MLLDVDGLTPKTVKPAAFIITTPTVDEELQATKLQLQEAEEKIEAITNTLDQTLTLYEELFDRHEDLLDKMEATGLFEDSSDVFIDEDTKKNPVFGPEPPPLPSDVNFEQFSHNPGDMMAMVGDCAFVSFGDDEDSFNEKRRSY